MPLWSDIRTHSTTAGELQPGDYVDIIETRVVPEDDRVRARTRGGKWISLLESCSGFEYASPLPLGEYKIQKVADLTEGFRNDSNLSPCGPVKSGEYVTIIETRVVPEDKCVRAKLSVGLWMSLISMEDGSAWARPREVVEAEEKRKEDLECRTCNLCNKVFAHNHHLQQHIRALHSFYCMGNVHHLNCFVSCQKTSSWGLLHKIVRFGEIGTFGQKITS